MSEANNDLINKGKSAAMKGYEKGNELMDKVSFLKNPRNKKIAWCVLGGLLCWFLYSALFGVSVSDIESATKDLMHEKGVNVKSVTLSKVGDNKYHGLAEDSDGDMVTVDVTYKSDGTIMAEWQY